jgi:uncharacterized membrane protein YbaN (DUF454 family)
VGQVLATVGVWLVVVGLPVFGVTILFLLAFLWLARRFSRLLAPWISRYSATTDVGGPPA